MDLITLALAVKKANGYTEEVIHDRIAGVNDVRINGDSVVEHGVAKINMSVTSEEGAFGLRYYNGALQVYDEDASEWKTISISLQNI